MPLNCRLSISQARKQTKVTDDHQRKSTLTKKDKDEYLEKFLSVIDSDNELEEDLPPPPVIYQNVVKSLLNKPQADPPRPQQPLPPPVIDYPKSLGVPPPAAGTPVPPKKEPVSAAASKKQNKLPTFGSLVEQGGPERRERPAGVGDSKLDYELRYKTQIMNQLNKLFAGGSHKMPRKRIEFLIKRQTDKIVRPSFVDYLRGLSESQLRAVVWVQRKFREKIKWKIWKKVTLANYQLERQLTEFNYNKRKVRSF